MVALTSAVVAALGLAVAGPASERGLSPHAPPMGPTRAGCEVVLRYSPKLTGTLLRRSGPPSGEPAEPAVASSGTRDLPRLTLARSVFPSGVARSNAL